MFGLNPIPIIPPKNEKKFPKYLRTAIRNAADGEHNRNVELENRFHSILSYLQLHDDLFLVRFACLDERGKPLSDLSSLKDTLYVTVNRLLQFNYDLIESGEKYEHFYARSTLERSEFLWIPNTEFTHTMVAQFRLRR